MTVIETTVEFFGKQYDAFNFNTQFGAAVAGVQSGKTFLGAHWAAKKILENKEGVGAIIAPTHNILRAATLKKFFDILPELRVYYKEQKGELHLPTGGIVYIRSADNPLGIEGITADWIWLDEGGMTSSLTWTVLRSRVSMTRGQILITTTPYNLGWLYQDFYLPWKNGVDRNLSFFTWKSIENPFFSKEFADAEKRRLRTEEFSRRYEGEFTKMEGLVYDLPKEQIIEPKEVNAKDIICGIDFGFNNPSAITIWKIDYDDTVFLVYEYKESGRTHEELEEILLELQQKFKFRSIYADPAEPARIESLRRRGFLMKAVDKDIPAGINKVNELILKRQLYIFNTNKNFLDEINSYHYDPDKQKEDPVKDNDHLLDSCRYGLYSYYKNIRTEAKIFKPNYGTRLEAKVIKPIGW